MARKPVLVLSSKETEDLITMEECIRACEEAFWELGHGIAMGIDEGAALPLLHVLPHEVL